VTRVVLSLAVGVWLMFRLDRLAVADVLSLAPGDEVLYLGAVGLALASALAAWTELGLLVLRGRGVLPPLSLPWASIGKMAGLAAVSLLPAAAIGYLASGLAAWLSAPLVILGYAAAYLGYARWRGWPELEDWLGRIPAARRGSE